MTKEMHVDELEGKIYRILEESTKSNDGGPFWFGSDNKNIFEYDLGEGKKGYCAFLVQRCHKPTVCCFMESAELPLAGKSIALPCGCKIVCELLPELPPDNVQEVVEEMIQKACKRMAAL